MILLIISANRLVLWYIGLNSGCFIPGIFKNLVSENEMLSLHFQINYILSLTVSSASSKNRKMDAVFGIRLKPEMKIKKLTPVKKNDSMYSLGVMANSTGYMQNDTVHKMYVAIVIN